MARITRCPLRAAEEEGEQAERPEMGEGEGGCGLRDLIFLQG